MKKAKRLLSVFFALSLALVLSMPAFADWTLQPEYNPDNPAEGVYSSLYYLNIEGSVGSYMLGRTLSIYRTANVGQDQLFTVQYSNYNGYQVMYLTRVQNGVTYAINRRTSDHRAFMWTLNGSEHDSAFYMPRPDSHYLIRARFYEGEGLHYEKVARNEPIYFGTISPWFGAGSPGI